MDIVRYIIKIILGVIGIYIVIMNWFIFWYSYVKKQETLLLLLLL